MNESEYIKEVVNQLAVQAAAAVMMVLRNTEVGPQLTTMVSHREPQRRRYSWTVLVNLAFTWGMQDRYIELMNFEVEDLNILEIKRMNFLRMKKPRNKRLVGQGGSTANTNF